LTRGGLRGTRIGVLRGISVALVCWLAVTVLYLLGAFETADLKLLDWRYRVRGPRAASDRIALVEIDDATIEAYGNWPLPRDQYALLIEAITQAGARSVGIDLLFLGSDRYDSRFDQLLAFVTASHGNVAHAITFSPEEAGFETGTGGGPVAPEALGAHGLRDGGVPAFSAASVTLPYTDLLASSALLGHVLVVIDRDGVIRRVPTLVRYRDVLYPCLGLSVVAGPASGPGSGLEPDRRGVWITKPGGRRILVPVDKNGATCIDYAGDRGAFSRTYSMLRVLQWYAAADTASLRDAFGDRTVLLGTTAVRQVAGDFGATPFSTSSPLLLVHANAVDAFLTGRFIVTVRPALYLAALAVLSVFLGWLLTAVSVPVALSAIAACLFGIAGLAQALFMRGVDMPPTAGLTLPPLIYAAIQSYQFVFLERKTRERQRELQVARDIQRRLLPSAPPAVADLDVFGINIPAHEVGGDYYDWIVLGDGSLAVAVGDVCGKGIPAAILMAHLEASFHAETKPGVAPAATVEAMNLSLERSIEPGRFATFILAVISPATGEVRVCNAGHNPAFLGHDGRLAKSVAGGLALGIFKTMKYEEERWTLDRGDFLVLYSDGITECQWKDKMYGDERLCEVVAALPARGLSAGEIGEAILRDVKAFCSGHTESDDVTLVVVKRR
jgi:serine phosphatase RsbU (regulator of sigma subunit)/CHASE2 domain-containing sensor protein